MTMLLAHAITLAEARSYLAALADRTDCLEVSEEYDRALLYLDAMHGAVIPALSDIPIADTELVYQLAVRAIESLRDYRVDALQIEIVVSMVEDAHRLDLLGWVDANNSDQHDIVDTLDTVASDPLEFDLDSVLPPDVSEQPSGGAEA